MDAHRRQAEQATRAATEAQQEADRYAASLEATRIAELPNADANPAADCDALAYANPHAGTDADTLAHADTVPHANTASVDILP